ncbi:Flagellar biosynthesis regulator FlaF [Roseomonas rosea]|jgi:flagellar biosynthesis activator protein FlaF|uniref:Flagellar biosynthesis regulator FlaF n=1 Tax=Muricoccus roseus TaxID=198092 RepID=A0A1M6QX67_9PROT|nr:flagellar biosynthesis regulator FlaF [Roseomonas rosea]SHK24872.1 Flagellar biosynthesis regulator FlaF [Roseomonas rosea]
MMLHPNLAHAYRAARAGLPPRAQEADVFRRVNGGLRAVLAMDGGKGAQAGLRAIRALADNRRLWLAVEGVLLDPTNALPPPLRASIISVGRSVLREMEKEEPDLAFLIEVNEQMAAGLSVNN